MLKSIFFHSQEGKELFRRLEQRQFSIPEKHEKSVERILEDVRNSGDSAIVEYTSRFDCPEFHRSGIKVTDKEIDNAYSMVDQDFPGLLRRAIANIREFHERQLPSSWMITRENGTILGQMIRPVDAAGLYVPGGTGGETPLVSSVLMNAIPAVIAGVKHIAMATPPDKNGDISPFLLVAAKEAGIDTVYRMGSAWAIAAMAFGTETVKPVDVIAGPGNIFVTIAKKLVSGTVGIDMIAGPSEILVIADKNAPPDLAAADMLSQAEHDPMATAITITDSEEVANQINEQLEVFLGRLERGETARKSLENNGVIMIVRDMDEAVMLANRIAPEHLELLVEDPWSLIPSIRHAGAIFMGHYTPEPMGDYIAGPNHVLPTMGTARFSSALGVETFIKRSSIISYTKNGFHSEAEDVMRLAETEGLTAHSLAVKIRHKED
jgi:histidinol dehydrogenase